eukprot:8813374-Pyramimonas_sp.AAC.1
MVETSLPRDATRNTQDVGSTELGTHTEHAGLARYVLQSVGQQMPSQYAACEHGRLEYGTCCVQDGRIRATKGGRRHVFLQAPTS